MSYLKQILNKPQIEQLTEEWFKKRYNMLTASECGTVLNINKYKTKKELLIEKCKPLEIKKDTLATAWGKKFEEPAFNLYSLIYNIKLYNLGLIVHDKIKWLGASADGIREDTRLLEIKCVYRRSLSTIPEQYWVQTQIQMEVLNVDECDLFQCKFIEISKDEYKLNKNNIKYGKIKGDNILYWKLEDYRCDTIKRNRKWFNRAYNELLEFFNTIQDFREKNLIPKLNNKRKRTNLLKKNKKLRYLDIDLKKWITLSDINNYILNDPLLIWLNLYGEQNGFKPNYVSSKYSFSQFLKDNRNKFKNIIYNNLKKKFNIKRISNGTYNPSVYKYRQTKKEMKNGTPIIFNGVLFDFKNKIYGTADIIVRSDYINKIYTTGDILERVNNGCKYSDKWHYRIITIRFCTLKLHKNKNTIQNCGILKCYKAQTIMLNKILSKIQNFTPSHSYIQARTIIDCNMKLDTFSKPGVIDILGTDKLMKEMLFNGIAFINKLKYNKKYSNKKYINKFYPNMCNKYDYRWKRVKKELAIKNKEITLIWNISYDQRVKYHNDGIYRYDEIKDHNNEIIQRMIDINLKDDIDNKQLYNTYKNIKIDDKYNGYKRLYVDFETTSIFENINTQFLYMIGIGWYEDDKWIFHNLVTDRLTDNYEKDIIIKFINIIEQFPKNILIHWSNAEKSIMNYLCSKHNIEYRFNWYDLMKVYIDNKVVIKDCYSFGLKDIAKTMYKKNIIDMKWEDEEISGKDALVIANKAEEACKNKYITKIQNFEYMNTIIRYNEIDCKILSRLHSQ